MHIIAFALAAIVTACSLFSCTAQGRAWDAARGAADALVQTAAFSAAAASPFAGLPPDKPMVLLIGDSITDFGFLRGTDPAGAKRFAADYEGAQRSALSRRQPGVACTMAHQPCLLVWPHHQHTGWALKLNSSLQGQAAVVNLGKGGSSTRGLIAQTLPRLLPQLAPLAHNVALAALCFGANDAVVPSR
jgi:hypothetical protein